MSITYRAAYVGEAVLTGPQHAHLSDDELMRIGTAEALTHAARHEWDEIAAAIQVGDWTSTDDDAATALLGRAGECSECHEPGVRVDTSAGEIVVDGLIVASVAGETRLMVDEQGRLLCDDCAEARR